MSNFSRNIGPHVIAEINKARDADIAGDHAVAFTHLENAHVLGQTSTRWHVKIHWLMMLWAIRRSNFAEIAGQLFRIFGAATMTAVGRVPSGNTGGSNVSPFMVMPIKPEHEAIITQAKTARAKTTQTKNQD